MTSAKRELTSVRASSLTEGSTPMISSTNDTFPLWPRPALVKSANSTENESTIYWSNQCTLSCAIIKPFLQRVSIACYAKRCISYRKSVRLTV